jgi:3-hydroxyisobutyrate dehydrogenase-like beta-hydroxyacid dehydrogenase
MTRVGFVGAGRMGGPMVRRLVEAGHDVSVLGRTPEKRKAALELGARAVTDLPDVAEGADVVVVCVFTDEQVRQVCLESDLDVAMDRAPSSSSTPRVVLAPSRRSQHADSRWSTPRSAAGHTTSRRAT